MNTVLDSAKTTEAAAIHQRAIIVDGHCDTPYRLRRQAIGLGDKDAAAQLDLQTLVSSGITASFFAAYVPPHYAGRGAADFARELITIVRREAEARPELLDFSTTSEGIVNAKRDGKIALMVGVEGGHAIEDSLDTLRELYALGARYLTLTHVNTNNWADSSGDKAIHGGLTPFGRQVVQTMNDLGMIVDISHVSDAAFYQTLETTRTPIIASHSSCRALTSHSRNMTDQMLRDLAANGGICMINFFAAFINEGVNQAMRSAPRRAAATKVAGANEEMPDDRLDWDDYCKWFASIGTTSAVLEDAVDHIVHAAEVAGVEHVGIGSDFDGVPALPSGLTDASMLPRVTERLLARGFHEKEIHAIYGGNFLRTFKAIEQAAR